MNLRVDRNPIKPHLLDMLAKIEGSSEKPIARQKLVPNYASEDSKQVSRSVLDFVSLPYLNSPIEINTFI